MTEREKQCIEVYIPSPRDPSLGDFEYFAKDVNDRIQRVEVTDIFPHGEENYYGVVQTNTRKRVKSWRDYGTFAMSDFYDNKEDCKNDTHPLCNYWEKLREIQQAEESE